jgi:NAD-dependent dihydropyrimidine dehydrogenase PreA subunit
MPDMEQLQKNLEARGFQTSHFATGAEACAYLNKELDGRTIGFGGSQTVRDMGLYEQLSEHNTCIWHWDKTHNVIPKDATDAQVYICSVNGLAESGEIVNIDGGGNRVASGLFGHDKVYFIVGSNKIAENLERAIWRARNVAAPKNARRLGKKTPCAQNADRCYDCKSPERICAALVIYWEKPALIPEVEVVLVDEPLGF